MALEAKQLTYNDTKQSIIIRFGSRLETRLPCFQIQLLTRETKRESKE